MKYTLITGASSGIGYAMARVFAAKGHHLILTARRENLLEKLKLDIQEEFKVDVIVVPADLSQPNAGKKLYHQLKNYTLEIMINNAGFGDSKNIWEADLDRMDEMISLNISALAQLSLNYIKDYHDQNATLMNVSSLGGYHTVPTVAPYCATKFYVSALTEGIARELQMAGKNMRAKLLAPANTESEFFDNAYTLEKDEKEALKSTQTFTPAETVAQYAYELFESKSIVGYINFDGTLELKDPIFPHF